MSKINIRQNRHEYVEINLGEHVKQIFFEQLRGTNSYEQWRANIHRELEEDLQRQVRELLEETEREERLAKLQRQFIRDK
ncbi:unnamed protein product [Rotaria sp. Silwood1]|nr:unnamed protein product [Rotaria sp. Silwood1]